MKKRQIIIIAALAIFVLGIMGAKALINQRKAPERKSSSVQARLVTSLKVLNDTIELLVPVDGKIKARQKAEIFPEVTGVLLPTSKPFKVGQKFRKGETILSVDGNESLLNLKAQRSAYRSLVNQLMPDVTLDYAASAGFLDSFLQQIKAEKSLPAIPELNNIQLENFLTGRNFYQQYYAIKSMENRQSKFTIQAPYDGVITSGELNPGTLLRAGQKAGEFISSNGYELESAVSVEDIQFVDIGDDVSLTLNGNDHVGKVSRVGQNIDPSTQRILVYASLEGADLKDGMYVEGEISADKVLNVFTVKRNLFRPDSTIFCIGDSTLKLMPVELVHSYRDEIYISGLPNGTLVLNQVIDGAYEGMLVKTNQP